MMIRMEDSMEDRKVYCNNCPCFAVLRHHVGCGITGYPLESGEMPNYYQDEADCPLDQIKLKDGFVYTPEVKDGEV
jgi:deoxycytidylate deaminase